MADEVKGLFTEDAITGGTEQVPLDFDEVIYLALLNGSKFDTVDPTVNDDANDGHTAMSLWVNTTAKTAFICTDPAVGAAVWIEITVVSVKRSYVFEFKLDGWITAQTDLDGLLVVPFACTVQKITMSRRRAGSSGSTIVDVNKAASGGAAVTLYTTQGNRPTIAQTDGDRKAIIATDPDITALTAGDYLSVDVDSAEGSFPLDLVVSVYVKET